MLQIIVVDASAESRRRLVEQVSEYLRPGSPELEYLPRISINPLSPQEVKFHNPPDICIIGSELLSTDITELGRLKKSMAESAFLAELTPTLQSMAIIEQLARYGADDFLSESTTAIDFIRKVVVLSRKTSSIRAGKLVLVDSGKGGIGVTSVAAGFAESLFESGKSVALIDLDFDTQDASRFLQARPFVNENLQAILSGSKPVTQEFVEECLVEVWEGESAFQVMSPIPESDALFDPRNPIARTFIAVIEVLDSLFDCVVVDMGSVRGPLLRSLYRAADAALFVINNDAASVYASVDRLQRVRSLLAPEASLVVVENGSQRHGLPASVLHKEFSRAAQISEKVWSAMPIPFCRTGHKWPGSSGTLFSQSSSSVKQAITSTAQQLQLVTVDAGEAKLLQRLVKNPLGKSKGIGMIDKAVERKQLAQLKRKALPGPEHVSDLEQSVASVKNFGATADEELVTAATIN
jgi:MinD-like ATPase involved in chromosome partitioning or flagellar assembly